VDCLIRKFGLQTDLNPNIISAMISYVISANRSTWIAVNNSANNPIKKADKYHDDEIEDYFKRGLCKDVLP
jgi:hypothetical protein